MRCWLRETTSVIVAVQESPRLSVMLIGVPRGSSGCASVSATANASRDTQRYLAARRQRLKALVGVWCDSDLLLLRFSAGRRLVLVALRSPCRSGRWGLDPLPQLEEQAVSLDTRVSVNPINVHLRFSRHTR